jgi:hypothetical protein
MSPNPKTEAVDEAKDQAPPLPAAPEPVPFTAPVVALKEYCVGKPLTLLYGMSALYGDPRYVFKTQAEWAALEREFWARPA